jgi:signal-transduction protein with cAMP-binding, CBS, and nucleotidyltransferase domain
MKIGVKVGDVMTREFVSVSPDLPVSLCAREMMAKHVGSLIVKDNQHLKGIITEGDIIKSIAAKKDLSKIKAKDVMTKSVISISPSEDMYDALVKMRGKKVRWLPVTIKGRVIGMLTVKDILRIEPSLFEIVKEFTPIKEQEEKYEAIKMRKKRDSLARGDVWSNEGECDECGAFGLLYNIDGRLICEECKEDEEKD